MEQTEDCGNETGGIMSNTAQRLAIHAGDPDEIFQLEARLLADYAVAIEKDVENIIAKFPGATGAAYVENIGENIPDETIKAAVKRLAASKFRQKGVAV
jgi:hypothetical protein